MSGGGHKSATVAAAVTTAVSVAAAVSTLAPSAPLLPAEVVPPLMLAAIASFVVGGYHAVRQYGSRAHPLSWQIPGNYLRRCLSTIDPVARVVAAVGLLAIASLGIWGLASTTGDPTVIDGRHFVNVHGAYVAITADEYDRQVLAQERIFSSCAALFAGVAWVLLATKPPPPDPALEADC